MPVFDINEVLATIHQMVRDGQKYISFVITDRDTDEDGELIPHSLVLSGFTDDPADGEAEYDYIDESDFDPWL